MNQGNDVENYAIEAKNLSYQVGQQYLLNHIDLKIAQGEHWLLYGMNGCGKTTLLSILSGFRQQTQGELKVFGEAFHDQNILQLRRRIGWVSSSFFDARYHHERVLDIVLSGKFGTYGLDWGLSSADHRRANALLDALGLADKGQQSYDRLSKGQRQNVLIARAFMGSPEILLLDEPCSGLDALAKVRFMKLLEILMRETNLTVLFVSHEINDVKQLFPHTILLRNGRLFGQGETDALFQEKNLSIFFQQKVTMREVTETQIQSAEEQGLRILKLLQK